MRKIGLASFDNVDETQKQFQEVGQYLLAQQYSQIETQLQVFQNALVQFSDSHSEEIRLNPKVRKEFSQICRSFGVDPLLLNNNNTSNSNNNRNNSGNENTEDKFYEISLKVIEICHQTKDTNGGLISVKEITKILNSSSSNTNFNVKIEDSDILKSLELLHVLGDELQLIDVGSKKYIKSIPQNLNPDETVVLQTCDLIGYVTVNLLRDNFSWKYIRCKTVIEDMVSNGILWVDEQGEEGIQYWINNMNE
ncbi:unnamed protein product [[Candida] boidinii]|uniref:Unnamed protein product n=1 Tax=Candida boidinii TaxID=5477 RepID=A0A9W6T375_CANBO|nr:hypothetical protein B5S30_g342 [[Candida] boidinii]OWB82837.1 hypothetical protein B5S33_g1465 [[Candida] boidinii]GME74071.1 unnamed protein product [[Candida] boidinii]GMG11555.1 unnamed protein product [[Candida] boidinii]